MPVSSNEGGVSGEYLAFRDLCMQLWSFQKNDNHSFAKLEKHVC